MPIRTCSAPLRTADAADSSSQLETASETQIEDRRSKIDDRESFEFIYLRSSWGEQQQRVLLISFIILTVLYLIYLFIERIN